MKNKREMLERNFSTRQLKCGKPYLRMPQDVIKGGRTSSNSEPRRNMQ